MNEHSPAKSATRLLTLCAALLVGLPCLAQEGQPTSAEALEAAVQLYDEGDYVGARHALMQVDVEGLDDEGRARHGQYVQLAEVAVNQQQQADLDQAAGLQAIADGRLDEAEELFQDVLSNEFASKHTRAAAENELEQIAILRAAEAQPPTEAAPPAQVKEEPTAEEPEDLSDQLRSLRAKVLTREGFAAINAGRLSEAERLFNQALENVPGFPEAVAGLQRVAEHEMVESDAQTLLERIDQRDSIAWQRTVSTFRSAEREVREHVLNRRFDPARQVLLRARQIVESGKQYADPVSRYEALLHDVEELKRYVDDEERAFHEEEVKRQREEALQENEARLRSIREAKEKHVATLMSEALQLRKDREYEAAIGVLKQVVTIDPKNDQARWLLDDLEDRAAYEVQRSQRDELYKQQQGVLIDAERSKIPWWQPLSYPKNWLEIINRPTRILPGGHQSTIDANLQSRLDAPVHIDLQGEPFDQAIEMLAKAGDVDISVVWKDLASAAVDQETPIKLRLKSAPLRTALREVLDQVSGTNVELDYRAADGIIKVASRDLLDRDVYEEVYNIRDLLMPIPDYAGAPRMDLVEPAAYVDRGQREAVWSTEGAGQEDEEFGEALVRQQANDIITLIRNTIEPDSWRANQGDIGSISEINGQLVVTQTPTGHARVGGLLAKLREERAIQIAVEARFLTVQSNYLEELGLDVDIVLNSGNAGFDFLENPDARGNLLLDPVLGSRLLLPRSLSRLGFTPAVPGFGTPLTGGTSNPLLQPYAQPGLVTPRGNNFVGSQNTTPFPIANNVMQFTNPANLTSDLPGSFAGNPTLQPALSVFGSFLDNIQVDFLLRATQADSRTTLLNAPRLTFFNGQRSWIAVVNQQSFVSSLQPVVNAEGQAPTVRTIETGAVLEVQGVVSADKRYVTMNLRPSVGRLLGIQTFAFTTGAAAGEGSFVQLPNISRTVIRTTVSVPDGGTLLIGGQKIASEIEVEAGVPILSKIPVLKRLYSDRTLVKDEQVLLILIKPTVIIHREAEQEAFPTFGSNQ